MADLDDMERYADYNEIDEETPKRASLIYTVIKIVIGVVIVSLLGILVFRMIASEHIPDKVGKLYFTDALTAYYHETGGDMTVETQKLRASYDDPDNARFFASDLYLIDGAQELQITLKYNVSALKSVAQLCGTEPLDPNAFDAFSFKLLIRVSDGENDATARDEIIEMPAAVVNDSYLMYRYYKLAFDGVDFSPREDGAEIQWIQLQVYFNGADPGDPLSRLAIYEKAVGRTSCQLSESEVPADAG